MCNTRPHNWENLRANYQPDNIRVLFIGESPPASGKFFYRENSTLYFTTKEAFNNPSNFLIKFQNWGFFLDDLVLFPINRFDDMKRKAERLDHQAELATRLMKYQPLAVVTVMKGIKSPCRYSHRASWFVSDKLRSAISLVGTISNTVR